MATDQTEQNSEPSNSMTFAEFLESVPPGREVQIQDDPLEAARVMAGSQSVVLLYRVHGPNLRLHCTNEACGGIRFFRHMDVGSSAPSIGGSGIGGVFLRYICANCGQFEKTYSLSMNATHDDLPALLRVTKYGELPIFGVPVPSRLLSLIGDDREVFLKGRRCENQGLGIGAFIYYRRVVENQKDRILDRIIKSARKLNAAPKVLDELNKALTETQFSKALDISKDAMPESLLIKGHNPLRLLHSALSEGVHARSDEECLGLATSVRVVLSELSERMDSVLKEETELNRALSNLLQRDF